jgi:hypothetical protein
MRRERSLGRRGRALLTVFATSIVALVLFTPGALAVAGASFTTANFPVDGDHCLNGQNNEAVVNCNIYDGKQFVWINGGPNSVGPSSLTDGDYFFAVLVPGGQPDPNDDGAKNLSDESSNGGFDDTCGDAYTNRIFTVSGGDISAYTGDGADYYTTATDCDLDTAADPHQQSGSTTHGQLIRLFPYDTTNNPGGVYILAMCRLGATGGPYTYPVDPRDCKYDAFKVRPTDVEIPPAAELAITKTAVGSFDRTYTWQIDKTATAPTSVSASATTAMFNYIISVTHSSGTNGNWQVNGSITVDNFNDFDVSGVDITDAVNDASASCVVANGTGLTLPAASGGAPGEVTVGYTCTYSAAPANNTETNTATVSWPDTEGNFPLSTEDDLAAGSAPFSLPFSFPANPSNLIDDCVAVVDDNFTPLVTSDDTTLAASWCVGGANPKTFNLSRTVNVPRNGCASYTNTAKFTTNDSSTTGTDDATVNVCGTVTGGLTIGFWQNKNGQAIISTGGASTAGVCNSGTYLRGFIPFLDLPATASCSQVALYVTNIIKAATAKGAAMNAMLKAQMLATALDVFFSKVGGGTYVDLTKICKMIDGSGGAATCSGVYRNVSAAFGGATCLTVNAILAYASSQSSSGGGSWYGQVKATQELAKDTFDAINNQVAFSCTP